MFSHVYFYKWLVLGILLGINEIELIIASKFLFLFSLSFFLSSQSWLNLSFPALLFLCTWDLEEERGIIPKSYFKEES